MQKTLTLIKPKMAITAYNDRGEGSVIVMLNGITRTRKHWFGLDEALAGQHRVVTCDLLGAGDRSDEANWSLTIDAQADAVIDLLDQLNIEKAHFCGVSLGGMVTLSLGMRYPERCLSLFVINSSIGSRKSLFSRLSKETYRLIVKGMVTLQKKPAMLRQTSRLMLGSGCTAELEASIIAKLEEIEQSQPVRLAASLKQLVAALRFIPGQALRACAKVPTMVLYGTADRFVPNLNSKMIAASIPGSELLAMEGAGHEPMQDRREDLSMRLLHWLMRVEENVAPLRGERASG